MATLFYSLFLDRLSQPFVKDHFSYHASAIAEISLP